MSCRGIKKKKILHYSRLTEPKFHTGNSWTQVPKTWQRFLSCSNILVSLHVPLSLRQLANLVAFKAYSVGHGVFGVVHNFALTCSHFFIRYI